MLALLPGINTRSTTAAADKGSQAAASAAILPAAPSEHQSKDAAIAAAYKQRKTTKTFQPEDANAASQPQDEQS